MASVTEKRREMCVRAAKFRRSLLPYGRGRAGSIVLSVSRRTLALDSRFAAIRMCYDVRIPTQEAPIVTLQEEFDRLTKFIQGNMKNKFAGWKVMRDRFLNHFGGTADSAASIDRANAYYAQLVEAKFPGEEFAKPNGRLTPVHPRLRERFGRTVALLRAKGVAPGALSRLRSVGGFQIRENANNANELSEHSFGCAVDLDPELNPNIKKKMLPVSIIKHLTGLDPYGEHSEGLRVAAPFDALLAHARALTAASQDLVRAFSSSDALRASLHKTLNEQFDATASLGDLAELEGLVRSPTDSKQKVIAKLTTLGVPHSLIADAELLLRDCFGLLTKRQQEATPRVQGTAASIAAFGFVNLPPELIAAMIATDGGGLNWLGSSRGTKDFMHFELRTGDKPPMHG